MKADSPLKNTRVPSQCRSGWRVSRSFQAAHHESCLDDVGEGKVVVTGGDVTRLVLFGATTTNATSTINKY